MVPTITVDKTDGIEIYLSNESLQCEIVSSKSSEINVSVLNASGDYVSIVFLIIQFLLKNKFSLSKVEHPLPEQYKSVWTGNGFKTIALDG